MLDDVKHVKFRKKIIKKISVHKEHWTNNWRVFFSCGLYKKLHERKLLLYELEWEKEREDEYTLDVYND